jgi:1,4-alpha-glucan branching enzyme
MPYVEGFGTWPFGEEWLWEAMAVCYLPLLELLDRGAPVTVSITPVLGDQLAAAGIGERFVRFLTDVRRSTHAEDVAGLTAAGAPHLARELERAADDYERALECFEAIDGDLLGELARHATWTSAATHAVLPLCATDAGVRLQIAAGIAAHEARCGDWSGGFWLPECAYAPWLDELLSDAGARFCCVDVTDHFGFGAAEHLRPLKAVGGLILMPIDRATIELVWSDDGYPSDGRYRDYHRHTLHHHRPWANDGAPYDHAAAIATAREHAREFVRHTIKRVAAGGLAVCALDTELLGHWWYEGIAWLEAVIEEADRQGLRISKLEAALERREPVEAAELAVSSWGTPRDLSTWDGPPVAELAFETRAAELRVLAAGPDAGPVAVRELLALQSSDWAFMKTRALAADYPVERARGHARALAHALAEPAAQPNGVRNLAVHASTQALMAP